MRSVFTGLICFVVLSMAVVATADDAVIRAGGVIAGNTIWEGRVLVEREVTVSDNATLTIRPGTSVSFRKGAGLVIGGVLVARGTPEAPVRFASAETAPGRGDWAGIRLQGSGVGSVVERCRIVHAATAIVVLGGAPAIRECEISMGVTGVGIERNASPVVSGNRITEMTNGGIGSMLGASPTIEGNTLVGCGGAGIFVANNSAPVVRGNTVEGCEKGIMINGTVPPIEGNILRKNRDGLNVAQSGKEQVIRGNRFERNEVGLRCENFSAPLVEGNEFTGNGDGIFCYQASSPMIRRNGITGNRRGIACSRISSPRIVANEIRDNGKGIHLTLSSYAVVNGNNLHGNGVQIELDDMSSDWELRIRKKPERGAQAQLASRISRGKSSREELAVNTDDRAALMDAVDATGNWWGEATTGEMEKKGPRANIDGLKDGYDVPFRTYVGYPGEYAQDRIRYDGWVKSRIPLFAGIVKGKVNHQGKPLEGAVVHVFTEYAAGFRGAGEYRSRPTGKDGAFDLSLPKGRYFVVAKKTGGGKDSELAPGDSWAYYGGNPVVVGDGETIVIGINCTPVDEVGARLSPGGTGIRGVVLADGKPLGRARVTLYQDGETIFRGIGYASSLTNGKGEFSFNLEPGVYYVVARKRMGDDKMGPLGGGDFFGFAHDNPVKVGKDGYLVVSIHAVNKLVKVKEGGQEVTLGGTVKSGETVVEGIVRGRDGKPVSGVYANAYRDSMMTQKPDFISGKTGPDGAYVIHFAEGGDYFIGARNTIGGPAEKGDLLGKYDGNEDHSVKIRTGEKRKGIDIVVEAVE